MKILGEGKSNGGISILHAAGLSRGCSVGIDLPCEVTLVDEAVSLPHDQNGLLDAVIESWNEAGLPCPSNSGWKVESQIPVGQGLKSSAAVACAATRALDEASWTSLSDYDIVEISVSAQRKAGCTITGSMDDAWAAISSGWKLVDPTQPARDSILLHGDMEKGLEVLIALRGSRQTKITPSEFKDQRKLFERALASVSSGSMLGAMSANGMAVAAAIGDDEALRICNSAIARGAIAAGISGSGPAIAVVCYEGSDEVLEILQESCVEVIRTAFIPPEQADEEVSRWG